MSGQGQVDDWTTPGASHGADDWTAAPAAAPAPESPGILDTAIDVARAVPGGLLKGVDQVAGMTGDTLENSADLLSAGANAVGADGVGDAIKSGYESVAPLIDTVAPRSSSLDTTFTEPTGGFYKPTTTTGKVAETAASFAPALAGGEGSIAPRVISRVIAPAIGDVFGGDTAKAAGLPEKVGNVTGTLLGAIAGSANPNEILAAMRGTGTIAAPAISDLKNAASAAYDTVDNSGMIISKAAMGGLMKTIKKNLTDLGYHPNLQPKTAAVLDALNATGRNNQTFQGMDVLRRIANNAVDPMNKSDTMMSRTIVDNMDDFVNGLGPGQVIGGAVDQNAIDALGNARDLWSRAAKGQQIQDLINKAAFNSQSMTSVGSGQALRTAFRQFANNPRAISRFAPDEQAAIRRVATGGPVENVARLIGKLSPDQTIPMLSEMGAFAMAPSLETAAVPAAGYVGKKISGALTARAADRAAALVRSGQGRNAATTAAKPSTLSTLAQTPPAQLFGTGYAPYSVMNRPDDSPERTLESIAQGNAPNVGGFAPQH